MSIVVTNPKKHPDCEYCKAADHSLKASSDTLMQAVSKVKKQAKEIEQLEARIKELVGKLSKISKLAQYGDMDHMAAPGYCSDIYDLINPYKQKR